MKLSLVGLVAAFVALAACAQPIAAQGGDNDQDGGGADQGGGGGGDQGGPRFLLRRLAEEQPATANALWAEANEDRYSRRDYRRDDRRDDRRDYRRYDRRGERYEEADDGVAYDGLDEQGRDDWN